MRASVLLLASLALLLAAVPLTPGASAASCAVRDPGVGPIGTDTAEYATDVCNDTLGYAQAVCNDALNPFGLGCTIA